MLDAQLTIFAERWDAGSLGVVLSFFSIVDGNVLLRGMLRFLGGGVVELGAQIGDVIFHREAAGALVVFPLEVDPLVQVAFLVDCYFVVLFDGVE